MPNNPMLNYKPGLTMDAPIPVTLAAADWIAFMTWVSGIKETDGIAHIVWGPISEQVTQALYTPASLKGAEADLHERFVSTYPSGLIIPGPAMGGWTQATMTEDDEEDEDE